MDLSLRVKRPTDQGQETPERPRSVEPTLFPPDSKVLLDLPPNQQKTTQFLVIRWSSESLGNRNLQSRGPTRLGQREPVEVLLRSNVDRPVEHPTPIRLCYESLHQHLQTLF
ncbi:hypothetical protein D3C81_1899140 [compost metagenome]